MKEQSRHFWRLITGVMVCVAGLVLIYFVTAGPAISYAESSTLTRKGSLKAATKKYLGEVYKPSLLLTKDTPFEGPFVSYVNWWREVLYPRDPRAFY
jgi:hypothetical protein